MVTRITVELTTRTSKKSGKLILEYSNGVEKKDVPVAFGLPIALADKKADIDIDARGEILQIIVEEMSYKKNQAPQPYNGNIGQLADNISIDDEPEVIPEKKSPTIKHETGDLKAIRNREGRIKGYELWIDRYTVLPINWREIPRDFQAIDGKQVEAEVIDQMVVAITYDERPYTDVHAKAPYNFVNLDSTVIPIPTPAEPGEKYSGFIALEIQNLTPLFIRGENEKFFASATGAMIPGSSIRGMCRNLLEIASFSRIKELIADDQLFFRAVFEKGSLGDLYRDKFIDIDQNQNPPLWKYKVGSGWLRKNGQQYTLYPSTADSAGRQFYKVSGRFLNNDSEFQVGENNLVTRRWDIKGPTLRLFDYCKVFFDNTPGCIRREKNKGFASLEYNEITSRLLPAQNPAGTLQEAYFVTTGHIDRKHYQWVINPAGTSSKPVEHAISLYRQDDNRDEETNLLKLIDADPYNQFPCFYLEENGNVLEIGHTGLFRIAYAYNIHAAIRQKPIAGSQTFADSMFGTTDNSGKLFFEDAIADKTEAHASKLSVFKILGGPKTTTFQHYIKQPQSYKTPLQKLNHWSTPGSEVRGTKLYWHKPQFRCTPDSANQAVFEEWEVQQFEFKKDDFLAFLREIKGLPQPEQIFRSYQSQFRLRDADRHEKIVVDNLRARDQDFASLIIEFFNLNDQQAKEHKISKPQNVIARPIVTQVTFNSRIRFENLSKAELGALLFILDLPKREKDDHYCHKLGMGKPLGLGSVHIKPNLFLVNRTKRYSNLFNEKDNWETGIHEEKDLSKFKLLFQKHINGNLGRDENADLWGHERMRQLLTMLTFDHGVGEQRWQRETSYMTITPNQFKDRRVLPDPEEVVKLAKINMR